MHSKRALRQGNDDFIEYEEVLRSRKSVNETYLCQPSFIRKRLCQGVPLELTKHRCTTIYN
ncbi:hypothetical protein WICANDRAFT_86235 [Wickerhamomyces anomalus NRRL Y-366-8]|uniref:Uncharacterized protein n=1 Tax=Wickerhamomyces anomalus (strain ATCC 58044 / CBS 1984 / NCYC 433 / NRRL Y-366-8) TaxID=683960 RepID=A0A1E3NUM8_WICAA|nr:uncharacterized protein WICANDRAFT_86235 [Wickerhamomyces anomalus NRRL Y-366-8]ODQ56784.1 hypothetical protein WICANDRAFT_86235 [Wickerhamomyces anomalus NRRL Y-366-8]